MKLTILLLCAGLLQVQAGTFSQSVSFSGKNVPLETVFNVIKKQSGFVFFYNEQLLNGTKSVTVNFKNTPLNEVLALCLNGQSLDYTIKGKTITLKRISVISTSGISSVEDDSWWHYFRSGEL